MISFDTNILVYAADAAAGERHRTAAKVIERSIRRGNCIQTLQSLCEFFSVVTRKTGIEASAAAAFVEGWRSVVVLEASTLADLDEAIRAAFRDAMLWATARRASVCILISEDLQDGQTIEGVRIVNPFAPHNATLIERALGH